MAKEVVDDAVVRWAAGEAAARLEPLGDRWLHVRGVGGTRCPANREHSPAHAPSVMPGAEHPPAEARHYGTKSP